MAQTPLFRLIADEILSEGPIALDRYMAMCLGHPEHGYYTTRDPLGAGGDFVTAPEISQMFGELIGIWIADTWARMGAPSPCLLVELGPGRGTLMADALRALSKVAPDARFSVHLVETSPVLRARQEATLAASSARPTWHASLAELPDGPAIIVANEFFDALPVRQFQRVDDGWRERRIGLASDERLVFGLAGEPEPILRMAAPSGAVLTVPSVALGLVRELARRLVRDGGALLAVDYGHTAPGYGDTLQAVARHGFTDPLFAPGEADLTTHVDFHALSEAARAEGAACHGGVDQGAFLRDIGLHLRAERLKARASEREAAAIDAAVARLTDPDPGGMGRLFKVLAVADPRIGALAGFPEAPAR